MSQTDIAEKVDEKWGYLSSFHVFLLSYGPYIAKDLVSLVCFGNLDKFKFK